MKDPFIIGYPQGNDSNNCFRGSNYLPWESEISKAKTIRRPLLLRSYMPSRIVFGKTCSPCHSERHCRILWRFLKIRGRTSQFTISIFLGPSSAPCFKEPPFPNGTISRGRCPYRFRSRGSRRIISAWVVSNRRRGWASS